MSSRNEERYRSKNSSIVQNVENLEKSVEESRDAAELTIRTAVEPILSLPETLDLAAAAGRLPEAVTLAKTIAKDNDLYIERKGEIDEKFSQVKSNRPTEKRQLANYFMDLQQVGGQYIDLNQEMVHTLVASSTQLIEITKPAEKQA